MTKSLQSVEGFNGREAYNVTEGGYKVHFELAATRTVYILVREPCRMDSVMDAMGVP
jgi:hypothetical protein